MTVLFIGCGSGAKPPGRVLDGSDSSIDSGTVRDTAADADGDGFAEARDCDDSDALVHAGATETCDGVDQDCDGAVDEDASDAVTWYDDADGDGHGDASSTSIACDQPARTVAVADDCDDANAAAFPGRDERCDTSFDDDCDGTVNEDDAVDASSWLPDDDADGFGDDAVAPVVQCEAYEDWIAVAGDCDDADSDLRPTAHDVCDDGVDQDCDGVARTCPWDGEVAANDSARTLLATAGVAASDELRGVTVGDVDGDGLADLVLGYPDNAGSDEGVVAIVPAAGAMSREVTVLDVATLIHGSTARNGFGWAVSATNDLDGDAITDLVVTGPWNDSTGTNSGAVFLFAGPVTTASTDTDAVARLSGEMEYDILATFTISGDLNADGNADLILATPVQNTNGAEAGAFYVLWGPVEHGEAIVSQVADLVGRGEEGWSMGTFLSLGDLDADGYPDLAVAVADEVIGSATVGAVRVYGGASLAARTEDAGDPDLVVEGNGYAFGTCTDIGDDFDGSGIPDLITSDGASGTGFDAGYTWIFYDPGASGTLTVSDADVMLVADGPSAFHGVAEGVGDVNGDAYDDLLVFSPNTLPYGVAYLLDGRVSEDLDAHADADAVLTGGSGDNIDESHGGYALGDLDSDGFDDFLVPIWERDALIVHGSSGP